MAEAIRNSNIEKDDVSITTTEEAKEFIRDLLENGDRPVITVPKKFETYIAEGLKPHSSWIPDLSLIAATLGREAYTPQGEERVKLRIDKIDPKHIHPRFTGPDCKFHGVVIIDGPILSESITILEH